MTHPEPNTKKQCECKCCSPYRPEGLCECRCHSQEENKLTPKYFNVFYDIPGVRQEDIVMEEVPVEISQSPLPTNVPEPIPKELWRKYHHKSPEGVIHGWEETSNKNRHIYPMDKLDLSIHPEEKKCTCEHPMIESNMCAAFCRMCGLVLRDDSSTEIEHEKLTKKF